MIFVFYFHYDIAFTPLVYAYRTEIFPYALRGLGVTLTYLVGHLGLIISLFLNPIAMKNIGWRYYTLFCILNALLFAIVWVLFPETKGHSLEEIAILFEGDATVNKVMPDLLEPQAKGSNGQGECSEIEIVGKAY
jgi:MFS family permease